MSVNQRTQPNLGGSDDVESIEPTITDSEGREVTPVYTKVVRKTTENDNVRHTSLCGETEVEAVGERETSITIEGLVLKEQLLELKEMRPANNPLTIIDDEGVHRDIEFDRFTREQKDELNVATFEVDGTKVTEPVFEFQLQTVNNDT